MDWVILIDGGCGFYLFKGSEMEAEDQRRWKAIWEHAVGRKRLATEEEIKTGIIDECKNHPNFKSKDKYHCTCPKCELIVRRKKIEKIKRRTK